MLTIRMQRTGRKGLANFRVVVQDSRFSPDSGRVVAQLGHYNPHTKEVVLDKEKAEQYLQNGAQPSPRVVRLLESEKVKLPSWVNKSDKNKKSKTRNPEKLRKNQPKEEISESTEEVADEEMAEEIAEVITEEAVIEEVEKVEEAVKTEAEKIVEEAEAEEQKTEESPAESDEKPAGA